MPFEAAEISFFRKYVLNAVCCALQQWLFSAFYDEKNHVLMQCEVLFLCLKVTVVIRVYEWCLSWNIHLYDQVQNGSSVLQYQCAQLQSCWSLSVTFGSMWTIFTQIKNRDSELLSGVCIDKYHWFWWFDWCIYRQVLLILMVFSPGVLVDRGVTLWHRALLAYKEDIHIAWPWWHFYTQLAWYSRYGFDFDIGIYCCPF